MIGQVLRPWRTGRLWPSLVHVVLDLPVGVVAFVPTAVLLGATLGAAIVVPLAVLTLVLLLVWTDVVGTVERSRAGALLDVHLDDPVPRLPGGSVWNRFKAGVTERARWKQVAYSVLRLPVGAVLFAIVVGAWAWSLAMAALPAYVTALPQDTAQLGVAGIGQGPAAVAASVLGVVGVVAVAPWLSVTAAAVDRSLARWLLGPSSEAVMAARAARAESGRVAALDAAAAERRRIERDLHDGAQQRLVALAMDLGAARERLETDVEGGKVLVAEAHEEAKAALRELRDLVRGIHPVILEDRGLDAALSAVVARSPVPVELSIELPERPPEPVESTAYFVVSEALANVTRHAHATRARVSIARSGDTLIVEVRDDGVGGADPDRGTGLQGLRDRVVGLGGTMDVLSPAGGPTTVLVELPCAS
ncbi:MAG TPA: sensor domain-containing protein [Acidimicrobiales bacterium]|nr:sensor domain-containing protein [Acidimicrobiales bacterium]